MAQLVLSVAGAAVGFAVGGPAGAQWGWLGGSLLGALAGGKTQRQSQPLMDLKIVGTDYGQAIPYGRGTIPVAGQVWWNSDRQPIYNTTSQRTGKGGGQKTETTTITYKVDVLFGLTDIQIAGITRIWDTGSGKLIYHVADDAPVSALLASEATTEWDRMTVYTGAADQQPDPTYAAAVTNAPAYRHRGSVFIQGLNLGQSGQMRNLLFEVVIDGGSTSVIEREWGGMGTSVLWSQGQEIAYDPDRNELWTAYTLGSNGVGTTGKVAVYSLTDEAWTFIDPPAGYNIEANTNTSLHAKIYAGKFYTQVRIPSGLRTTAIYDVATKTLVGTVQDILSLYYGSDVMAAAIDEVNDRMWVEEGDFSLSVHTLVDGIPGVQLHALSAGDPGYVAVVDVNGNFWQLVAGATDDVVRISSSGVRTTFNISPYTPDNAHYSGAWVYDSARDCIYFFSTHDNWAHLYRFDCSDQSVSAVNATAFNTSTASNSNYWVNAIVGYDSTNDRLVLKRGYNYGASYSRLGYLNPDTGVLEQSIEVSSVSTDWAGGNVPAYGGFVWGLNRVDADSPDIAGFGEIRFATIGDAPPTVQEVVSDLCLRAGLSASQFDVTELASITRLVKCMPVAQVASVASVIDQLSGVYFFSCTADDKLRFFPRGGSEVLTIPYEDLGADQPGGDPEDPLPITEQSDLEIPAQLMVTYANISKDYEPDTQPSDRLTSTAENSVETLDLQLGLTPDEGKLVADAVLLDQSASRWTTTISVLGHYALLNPGDVVNVTMRDGSLLRMRSVRSRDAFPILKHELTMDEASALQSLGLTSLDYTPSTSVTAPIRTAMRLMDIPLLRDADDDTGLYVAAKPNSGTDFPGAAIFDSPDNSTFTRQATIDESAVFGVCSTVLGRWERPRVFDEANTLTVNVGSGTLSSSTRDLVLNNGSINIALVGSEVIQFVTATLVSTGVYTLSRLLRGCRGTEWAMNSHGDSERFVLLQRAGLTRVPLENSQLGLARYYKAITLGRALSSAESETITPVGISLKPFSPIDLRGARDTSNNLTITWQRRTRLSTRMIGSLGISVPLGEAVEQYEVDILSDASDPTVLRTITSTTPTAEYTAAQQTTDGFTPGDPIEVRIYQLSSTVGRGYALEGVI